jgi:hypothetical protein
MLEPPSAVAAAVAFAAAAAPATVHDLDAVLFTGEGVALCYRTPFWSSQAGPAWLAWSTATRCGRQSTAT